MKKALIAGATGLVGKHVVKELINSQHYDEIHILTRRSSPFHKHPLVQEHLVSFDELDEVDDVFQHVDDVFVTLGTTMKQAKTQEAFIKVDYTYPVKLAEKAVKHGVERFLIVTAMGASRNSRFFYNVVKGTLEERLINLEIPSLHIFRPSLLLGERYKVRTGEKSAELLSKPLSFLMRGRLEKYKPVKGSTVAAVMHEVAQQNSNGFHIYESDQMNYLGDILKA
ncbi:NAD(P)H-binding protein [Salipaludibacillus sp. HK11]|uniref:NAD(P)H-binding protein n=1 Tax=Salipaludibacillus sp. HK11 TaxID=3394320 RepID=UPI0039FD726A